MAINWIGKFAIVALVGGLLSWALVLPVVADTPGNSAGAPAAPEDAFKSKGLTKDGAFLVTADEAAMHDAARSVRVLKSKVASETMARANLNRSIDTSHTILDQIGAKLATARQNMKKMENDPDQYNQYVAPFNAVVKVAQQREAIIAELQRKLGNVEDSQQAYSDAAASASKQADAAIAKYAQFAEDSDLKAAIDAYNLTATPPVRLGPSATFNTDAAFVKKCAQDMVAQGIPVQMQGNVPIVEVVINGKKVRMIWDSGASTVSLSAASADALGIKPTDDDPTEEMTMADGHKVMAKTTVIPAIQLGPYTVEKVECVVLPPEVKDAPNLLGGSFQNHFLFKLDAAAQVLHLTPNDKSAFIGAPKVAAGSRADDGIASPFAGRPRELLDEMRGKYTSFEDHIYALGPGGDRVSTRQKFSPPIAIRIVAKTDSTDLRFAYAASQVIFNWENNQNQLRVDGGPANGRHKDKAGRIPANTWVTIDVVVLPDSMTILVDGKERYHTEADFSKVDDPVSVFQGAKSTVQVKSVLVGKPRQAGQ